MLEKFGFVLLSSQFGGRGIRYVLINRAGLVAACSMSPVPPIGDKIAGHQNNAMRKERHFALQKNSEPFRRQTTMKSVTDLPNGA
jgi:hypothetical protein